MALATPRVDAGSPPGAAADAVDGVAVTRLPSGLRVVTHRMPYLETASLGVWVDAGARHETVAENGLSHLLEHMAFKGTTTRSARQIAEEIEAVGGHLNAYTSRENTAFHAHVLKEDVPLALDILSDILLRPVFDPEELARERDVILQEIGEVADTPDDIVFDHMQEAAYPDQALGRPILGTRAQVAAFERRDVTDYMAKHYRAGSMVVAAAGRVDHDDFTARVAAAFDGLPTGTPTPPPPARYAGGEVRDDRPLEQTHVVLALPGVPYGDPDYYPIQVFNALAGGGMSSRLFQEVREVRGLAYSIYSFAASYVDSGLFGVYAGTGAAQVPELIAVIGETMKALADDVTAAEVARAQAQLKSGWMMSLESPNARCEKLARQLLVHNRPLGTAEVMDKLMAVDADTVRAVAGRVLNAGRPALSAVGPTGTLPSFAAVEAAFD